MRPVVCYDPGWPQLFAAEQSRIQAALSALPLVVEHIGSTAVPGLAAKPVIDILVGLNLAALAPAHLAPLRTIGYGYVRARRGGLCLYRGKPRSHFLHIVQQDSREWQEHLLFRNYLRAHPEVAQQYGALKLAAQTREPKASAYSLGKHAFIRRILAVAADSGKP